MSTLADAVKKEHSALSAHRPPFTRQEALNLWAWLVAGWADHLDPSGARTRLDGAPSYADSGGSYEGVTRMLWGLGGWLSRPEHPAQVQWRGQRYDLEALTRRALVNGCDPDSPGYWGLGLLSQDSYDQRVVECGQVAFVLWQTRARIWDRLDGRERHQIAAFLIRFGERPPSWRNNWALFWALNHASRKALGLPYEQAVMDEVLGGYLDGVYCGDGWYDDADARGPGYFDDYGTWVFAAHVLAWALVDGHTRPARRDELLARVRAGMQHYPYFFAADGGYNEFGRSLAYKFARLGAPLWAYMLGAWPHPPGMLRRLVGRHLRWYVDRGALRPDGSLRQPLTAAGSADVCEPYIATGSVYWAMQALGGLWSLPDDDPFWAAEEAPLPAEQGDYTKVYAQPGWVVTARGGQVHRFNGGSVKFYGSKYAKYVYSTQFPFNVGLSGGFPSPDQMLSLIDGELRGQRTKQIAHAVGENWLRLRYEQTLNGLTHSIETAIALDGDTHLRAHRLTLDRQTTAPLAAVEGGAAFGYIQGSLPEMFGGPHWRYVALHDRCVAIVGLAGYDGALFWQGDPGINSVYPHYTVPALSARAIPDGHLLLCLVHMGAPVEAAALLSQTAQAVWTADGSCVMTWDGREIHVPPATPA